MGARQNALEGAKLGSYTVISEIGRGGMAVVYRGRQESLNRPVAIKVLPLEFASTPELLRRFEREAEAMAALAHPNIVQIIDKGERDGTYYFVMEFVDGGSLKELLRERQIPLDRMLEIALHIAAGLEHAHAHGIVHRDLKPGNVLIEARTGTAKIADFGIAQFQSGSQASTLTVSNVSMGTLNYMAPEQKVDAKTVDHRADIYSFGVILYEMLTGDLPLGSFDPPSHVNKRIPRSLDEIVLRCLKTSPAARFQSVAELAAELRRARETAGDVGVLTRAVRASAEYGRALTATFRGRKGRIVFGLVVVAMIALAYVYYGARGRLTGATWPFTWLQPPEAPPVASRGPAEPAPPGRPARPGTSSVPAAETPPRPPAQPTSSSAPDLTPEAGDAIATKEQAGRAELRARYAKRSAENEGAPRYAKEKLEDGDRIAADAQALFAAGAFGRATAAWDEAVARYRAAEMSAAQGKKAEAKALEARRAADEARARALREKADERAGERLADAEHAYERGKAAIESELDFAAAAAAFREAASGYEDACRAALERLRREQAIEAMERSSYEMTGAKKRAELAGAARSAAEEWGRAEAARAEAEKVRASNEPALAAVAYEKARQGYVEAEAKAQALAAAENARGEAARAADEMRAARGRAEAAQAPELAAEAFARAEDEAKAGRAALDEGRAEVARVRFEHARASFEDAALAAAHERDAREVEAARVAMAAARDRAVGARAPRLAAAAHERASAEERAGDEERVNGRFSEARTRYEKALALYREAAAAAGEASRRALDAAREALSDARYRAYAASAEELAPLVFERAAAEEAQGDDDREAGRLFEARIRYERAQALYDEAARTAAQSATAAASPPRPRPADPAAGPPAPAPLPGQPPGNPPSSQPSSDQPSNQPGPAPVAPPSPPPPVPPSPRPAEPPEVPAEPAPPPAAPAARPSPPPPEPATGAPAGAQPPARVPADPPGGLEPPARPGPAEAPPPTVAPVAPPGATVAFRAAYVKVGRDPGDVIFPKGVACDPQGGFWVADARKGSVLRFGPDGSFRGEAGGFNAPYDLTIDAAGIAYVADAGGNEVVRVAPDGKRTKIGFRGGGLGEFRFPNAVALSPAGDLFVLDCGNKRLQRLAPDGRPLGQSSVVTEKYAGIAVDAQGRLYVCEPREVKRYEVNGGPGIVFLSGVQPTAVAVDPRGRVYVADVSASRIVVLDQDGKKLAEVTTGEGGGRLQYPVGIACDGARLYVLDLRAGRKVLAYDVR